MANELPSVGPADRAALLREGIVVVEVYGPPLALGVTGPDPTRAVELVRRRLGEQLEVEVLGDVPRELRPRSCVGHMEREPGRLQLRYVLCGEEHVDDIVVAEDEHAVVVFAMVCTPVAGRLGEFYEGPFHVYLERPLAGREVIDGVSGNVVPYKNVYESLGEGSAAARRACGADAKEVGG
jgi:hypothetical protein